MLASVRAFFEHLIDFAGLFPPAQLPLAQALSDYAQYRQGPESWMLGRFVISATQLHELAAFPQQITRLAPLRLSVIGRSSKDADEFLGNVRSDLADVANLDSALQGEVMAETYEVKLPPKLFAKPAPEFFAAELFPLMGAVRSLLDASPPGTMLPFFEFPHVEPAAVRALVGRIHADEMRSQELLNDFDSRQDMDLSRFPRLGWKLRCGGQDAAAIPSPEHVAAVLAECCAGIPWKATAGLHQPFRHVDAGVNALMHGFVNVIAAGISANSSLDPEEPLLLELLNDQDASHFGFNDSGLLLRWQTGQWRNIQTEGIRRARKNFVFSFGSCSFTEPCAELRKLGWLP